MELLQKKFLNILIHGLKSILKIEVTRMAHDFTIRVPNGIWSKRYDVIKEELK